jgi:hypothetical protein
MTIEINEESYIVGIWFSSDPETNNNWLGCVVRDPENPTGFKGWSRFRYAKGDGIWDNEDKKSWYTFKIDKNIDEDGVIELMEKILNMPQAYSFKDRIIVKGSLKKLMKLSKSKIWMNIKQVSAEEYKNE